MIKYCVDKWNKNSEKLKTAISADKEINDCKYDYLVKLAVECILNDSDDDYDSWNTDLITKIDNGDYQGTLLFLIPKNCYQPAEYQYIMSYVGYGSCSGCDTLLNIQGLKWDEDEVADVPTEQQVNGYMSLCKDIICNMIKPYNHGWRTEGEFCHAEDDET